MFERYDRWRYHPTFFINGLKDLKHVLPGLGTATALFVVYLGYKQLTKGGHHDHHDHHDEHVIIKGASHARQIQEVKNHHDEGHHGGHNKH